MANSFSIRGSYKSDIGAGLAKDRAAFASLGSSGRTHLGGLSGALSKVEKGVGGVGGAMSHAKGQIAGVLSGVGQLAGVGGLLGLSAGLGSAIKGARDFGSAMDLLQTQAGASASEVEKMTGGILAMSRSVGTGPEQLAAGLYHIESAGIRGAQALDILKVAAEGARVGNADLESVTNALVAATNSGVKGVESMTGAMGTLNAIVGSGNMRMEDLTAALGTGVLSTAKVFGVSIQSVGAALADMTNQGIPAVDAANGIRAAMRLMAAPTKAAAKELDSIGLSTTALAADLRSPGGILTAVTDLKDHMDKAGLSETRQAALLTAAFGGKQSQAILTLVGNIGKLKSATDSVAAGANSFDAAWAKTQQDVGFKWDKFSATLSTFAIKLGDKILPTVTDGLDAIGQWVDQNGDQMVAMFDDAVKAAEKIGGEIAGTVVPAMKSIAGAVSGAWNGIPADVRELLVKAFVADKVVKWTFGVDIAGSVGKALISGVGSLFKSAVSANMNVQAANVNVVGGKGLPGLPGGAGGAAAGGEGLLASLGLTTATMGVLGVSLAAAFVGAVVTSDALDKKFGGWTGADQQKRKDALSNPGQGQPTLGMGAVTTDPGLASGETRVTGGKGFSITYVGTKGATPTSWDHPAATDNAMALSGPATRDRGFEVDNAIKQSWKDAAAVMAKGYMTAAQRTTKDFEGALGRVGRLQMNDNRRLVQQQMGAALRIAKGTESSAKKVDQLDAIQRDLLKHGDKWAAEQVGKLKAIAAKKTSFSLNVTEGGTVVNISGLSSGRQTVTVAGGKWSGKTVPLARGGVMPADGRALVGEAGRPEIVEGIPGGGFRVTPIAPPAGGGAQSVEFHVHVHGANTPGAMREAAQAFGPQLVRWMQQNGFLPRTASGLAG